MVALHAPRRIRNPVSRRRRRRWHVLADLAREHGWTRGAELGVLRGETFLYLLSELPELTLIGVDLWEPVAGDETDPGFRSYRERPLDTYQDHVLREAGRYGSRAVLYRMPTVEAAGLVPDGSLDFVFIDADHTVAGVTGDIRAWAPKVKQTGWITGHDTHFPSVAKVIDELLPGYRDYPDHTWGIPKSETTSIRC